MKVTSGPVEMEKVELASASTQLGNVTASPTAITAQMKAKKHVSKVLF